MRVIVFEGYALDVRVFAKEHLCGEGLLRAGYGGRYLLEGLQSRTTTPGMEGYAHCERHRDLKFMLPPIAMKR